MLAVCQSVLLIFTTHEERRVLLRAKYASFLSLAISTADEKARKQTAIREKKSKYKLWWRTRQPEYRGVYLAAMREAKKAVSKAKSDRYKTVYDMLDTREGERAVYRLVRARHRSTLDMEHTKIVKGADGAVLRSSGQILERWREYYNHLCNEEFCHPSIPTVPSVQGPVLPITAVEVSAALAKMKSNKATGPNDMPADVWNLLEDRGSEWLATLFNKIVAEGRTPDVWQTSVTVPVWKGKGDIADCTSYRPIRLLCHTMKVSERVLEARLRKISWKDQLQQYGLRLNTSKTEYMECGPRIEDGSIRVDGTELNKAHFVLPRHLEMNAEEFRLTICILLCKMGVVLATLAIVRGERLYLCCPPPQCIIGIYIFLLYTSNVPALLAQAVYFSSRFV
ncbi:hypothetical protein NECAME_11794 [Necator americanus]|uniref:Reverse transcriptase domain-containing protein n=1 Tax=Necator americanus TaxID=51031 RepID=W2T532_NECAM|nr:hypothetical protein NECAME_11794 [Necator americanus]ETN76256.1 hypothetical protein NECAME_11794 [Necator americanus]